MQQHGSFSQPQQPMQWYSGGMDYNQGMHQYQQPMSSSHQHFGTGFDDEPPLLEELGIDLAAIWRRSLAILLHRLRSPVLAELDMGGALLYLLALGLVHLLMGKVHFGVLLGWGVVQSCVLYFVANQVGASQAVEHRGLDLYACCCITGYGLVPLVAASAGLLLVPKGPITGAVGLLSAAWCAVTAARVMARASPALQDVTGLLAVPYFLMYSSFALLTVY